MRFFRSLPPTPTDYRNEKALADLMLGEHAIGYVGGAGSCAGCGEATAIRMLVAATRQVHGPESMGIVAATGCNTVFGSTYPFNPYLVPWTNSLFENAPAVALGRPCPLGPGRAPGPAAVGPRRRRGDVRHRLPGAVADGRLGRGHQGPGARHAGLLEHRRPGVDGVVRRPGHEAVGVRQAEHGRPERRKELGRILMAHGDVYVAQTTPAHLNHFYRAVMEANDYPGPAVVIAYTACMPEHGIADDAATAQAKLAVESRAFPLFTYDPRRGATFAERLSLQGNPGAARRLGRRCRTASRSTS